MNAQSSDLLLQAFAVAPMGLGVVDADGQWVRVNAALAALLGAADAGTPAGTLIDPFRPSDRDGVLACLADVHSGRVDQARFELPLRSASGEEHWTATTLVRLPDTDEPQVLVQMEDVTTRREVEQLLTHRALHDPLTGLPNRTLLLDRIGHALEGQRRTETPLALLFCDLDRFKAVNDTLGHDVGDLLLVAVADRLRAVVRQTDTAARLGGDEFVVLLEGADAELADAAARRVHAALAEPMEVAGRRLLVTASIGVLTAVSGTAEDLLRDADMAMYAAKQEGRARSTVFTAELRDRVADRRATEAALREALAADELRVVYQPTVDVRTGLLQGAEALVRWEHPDLGLLEPDRFLDVAEDSGLIEQIGRQVLEHACAQAAAWRAEGRDLAVAVNLSARQLGTPGLADAIVGLLDAHDLPADRLRLEVTERVAVEAPSGALAELRRLRDLGVCLGIDDFGTGYAPMSYLKRIEVDFIKIDRGFVGGLGVDRTDTAIVEAIVTLGRSLEVAVVAAGVEQPAQSRALRDLGCELAQGYLFGRPRPATTAVARALQPVP